MNWKKWISIAAAVCLAVTAVPMRAVAQEELVQEKMLEEIKEEIKEELKEEQQEELKEEIKEELKEEKEEQKEEKEEKEKLQEQSDEKTEPQEKSKKELPKGISLLMGEENSTEVSGNEAADFAGEGTAANPYKIQNVNDLKKLAQKVNGDETANSGVTYKDKHFKLTADIDLKNEEWTPIGKSGLPFRGTFDGGRHQITKLKISNGGQYAGLFGNVLGATIQNCNVTGEINGYNCTGGIVGSANANTKIRNCSFQGDVEGTNDFVGGIVGDMAYGCEVSGCFVIGKVEGSERVGGIAGDACQSIKNCYYSGDVLAKNYAGGIAGVMDSTSGSSTTIENCVSLAESVSGSNANRIAGGIFGANLTKNHSYNRTKLVINGKPAYPTGGAENNVIGADVYISNGRVMKDVPNQTLFNWVENGFTKANGWSIPTEAGKLPSLREGEYPNLPALPEEPVPTKKRSGGGGTATPTYTAQFDTNGGSAVDKVKTDKNGKIERPADPTKEGYIFVGWYSDSKLTKPFDFSAELTANSTLYAKWKENNEIILTIGSRKISVFGREIKNDVAPKIVNDRTMLPIRIVAESLGGTVTWNGELQRVTIQKGADVILITIGADTAYVNGTAVKLDAAAFVENGRTYLPLRFVSETLGAQVVWNEAEKTVTITK